MANYAYIRTATKLENYQIKSQISRFKNIKIDKFFKDIGVSGLSLNRKGLNELLSVVKKGDNIYIRDFSRLSRDNFDVLQLLESLRDKGINVFSFENHKKIPHDMFKEPLKIAVYMRFASEAQANC